MRRILAVTLAAALVLLAGLAVSMQAGASSQVLGPIPLVGYFCLSESASVRSNPTSCNAPLVIRGARVLLLNRVVGVYVDNEVPDQCQVVATELKSYPLVIAGQAPGEPKHKCRGAINALEWYPYSWQGAGVAPLAIPSAPAYILQFRFHWPGQRAPTALQRATLLKQALTHHPKLILWY